MSDAHLVFDTLDMAYDTSEGALSALAAVSFAVVPLIALVVA